MTDRPITDEDVMLDEHGHTSDFAREWLAHNAGFVSEEYDEIEAMLEADDGVEDASDIGGSDG